MVALHAAMHNLGVCRAAVVAALRLGCHQAHCLNLYCRRCPPPRPAWEAAVWGLPAAALGRKLRASEMKQLVCVQSGRAATTPWQPQCCQSPCVE